MQLNDALTALAAQLDLDVAQLIAYAAEDTVGGFAFDETARKWDVGSLWEVEGRILYALTRALRPERIAEFGTHEGCSATHFLSALAANGAGTLYSVDPWEGAGFRVPDDLKLHWYPERWTGIEWLEMQADASFDILFEDMVHGVVATREWWRIAQRKIKPGGLIISHDAAHHLVGKDVMQGIREAGVEAVVYAIEPSDCGLAVWKAPGERTQYEPEIVEVTSGDGRVMEVVITPTAKDFIPVPAPVVIETSMMPDGSIELTTELPTYEEMTTPEPPKKKRGRKPKKATE